MGPVQTLYKSSLMSPVVRLREAARVRRWYRDGHMDSPPHLVKQSVVRAYARRYALDTLVETGTYMGDMVAAMRPHIRSIYTIELDLALYTAAKRRFKRYPTIHVLQGDSAYVLMSLLPKLAQPCLFWLDGHYSGEGTTRGDEDTPILRELDHILDRKTDRDVVLIDDARCFRKK